MTYASEPKPSREKLATDLRALADRVAAETVVDEEYLIQVAHVFNHKYAKTRFIMGTPEVQKHGDKLRLKVNFQPHNDAGVDSINLWVEGTWAEAQVAAQKVPEGGSGGGFLHVMARDAFTLHGHETPAMLADHLHKLSERMD